MKLIEDDIRVYLIKMNKILAKRTPMAYIIAGVVLSLVIVTICLFLGYKYLGN